MIQGQEDSRRANLGMSKAITLVVEQPKQILYMKYFYIRYMKTRLANYRI